MKIARLKPTVVESGITVSGPGVEAKPMVTYGAAVGFALHRAALVKGEPVTFYVREYGNTIARAEGDGQGGAVLYEVAA